ncbi:hypothetical protein V9T40_004773 [Parthenolecanium corni]|uniref:Uncharacterized protein n=1 Tax=Parthenolecanium corni TaxID=536013 RepID=A0AAN9TF34_9HEMI
MLPQFSTNTCKSELMGVREGVRVFFSKAFKKCALGSQLLHTRRDTVRRSLITDQLATPQLMISRFYQPNEKYRNYQCERNSRFTGITHSNLILKKKSRLDGKAKRNNSAASSFYNTHRLYG